MSGDSGRRGDDTATKWVYPAEARVVDKKRMGYPRGTVEYLGIPLPGDDLEAAGVEPGDTLGVSRERVAVNGEEVPAVVYRLNGEGEEMRQIRGGSERKPTWLVSVPYSWVEYEEYPEGGEQSSFLPLQSGDLITIEFDRDEEVLRVFRAEAYQRRLAGLQDAPMIVAPAKQPMAVLRGILTRVKWKFTGYPPEVYIGREADDNPDVSVRRSLVPPLLSWTRLRRLLPF